VVLFCDINPFFATNSFAIIYKYFNQRHKLLFVLYRFVTLKLV
jgi:hypothetical protein